MPSAVSIHHPPTLFFLLLGRLINSIACSWATGHVPTAPVCSWVECLGDPVMPPVPQVDLNPHTHFLPSILFKWRRWLSSLRLTLHLCFGSHALLLPQGLHPFPPPSLLTPSMRLNMCKSLLSLRNILPQVHYFPPATTTSLWSPLKLSFLNESSGLVICNSLLNPLQSGHLLTS